MADEEKSPGYVAEDIYCHACAELEGAGAAANNDDGPPRRGRKWLVHQRTNGVSRS